MTYRSWILIPALVGALCAQPVPATPSAPAPDPLAAPAELQPWARKLAFHASGTRGKVQAILDATFRSVENDGLGMVYDNLRTRTVNEVWADRKANCLGLTAFLVTACRAVGIEARFAEPVNINHWRREGQLVRLERHVVAYIHNPPLEELVADFLPQLRKGSNYVVDILSEARIRALFRSNRAVELMEGGDLAAAEEFGRLATESDPTSSAAWNIQGVVQRALNQEVLAEASYRKAHLVDPKDGAPIGNLELLMRDLGRTSEAAHFRDLSVQTRKKDPYFNAFLAEEAFGEARLGDALSFIRTAIKLSPYDSELYLAEARIRLDEGKPEEAKKALEQARRWAQPRERARYDSKLALLVKN